MAAIHAGIWIIKFLLACFVGTHSLLAGFIAYIVLRPGVLGLELVMQFGALLAGPLSGTALTLGTLRALLVRACAAR